MSDRPDSVDELTLRFQGLDTRISRARGSSPGSSLPAPRPVLDPLPAPRRPESGSLLRLRTSFCPCIQAPSSTQWTLGFLRRTRGKFLIRAIGPLRGELPEQSEQDTVQSGSWKELLDTRTAPPKSPTAIAGILYLLVLQSSA